MGLIVLGYQSNLTAMLPICLWTRRILPYILGFRLTYAFFLTLMQVQHSYNSSTNDG